MGLINFFIYMVILKGIEMILVLISFFLDGWQFKKEKREQLIRSWYLGGNKEGLELGVYNGKEYRV